MSDTCKSCGQSLEFSDYDMRVVETIAKYESTIRKLSECLKIAEEGLEFYANVNNWIEDRTLGRIPLRAEMDMGEFGSTPGGWRVAGKYIAKIKALENEMGGEK